MKLSDLLFSYPDLRKNFVGIFIEKDTIFIIKNENITLTELVLFKYEISKCFFMSLKGIK